MPRPDHLLRSAVIGKHGNHCFLCGKGPLHGRALRLTKKNPSHRGGQHTEANLVPTCMDCHVDKEDITMSKWLSLRKEALSADIAAMLLEQARRPNRKEYYDKRFLEMKRERKMLTEIKNAVDLFDLVD